MLHFAHHWPAQANVRFWPQAIEYAIWVFNRLPNLTNGLSPNELWSSCRAPTEEFHRSHAFGCPVYVLDATLQDGHKIPKWVPRACLGVFLGFSSLHSSQVPLVMNVDSGKISPQFHVIFDDKFETVLSLAPEESIGDQWKSILRLKRECFADVDVNENGNEIIPPLTSIFQQADVVPDSLPHSTWNSDPLSPVPRVSTHPSYSVSTDNAAPTCEPTSEPTSVAPQASADTHHPAASVSEGASHDASLKVDHTLDSTAVSAVDNGWPRRNVGAYKDLLSITGFMSILLLVKFNW
jgi:hypothetical protein